MVSAANDGRKDMNKRSPKAIILPVGGLLLSAIAALLGVGSLILAFDALQDPCYMDYMFAYIAIPLGLVLLVLGIVGLRVCIRRIKGGQRRISRLPYRSTLSLETLEARVAAGLCPKCGALAAATDMNCPWCGIDLAWAREHLDELAGDETPSLPDGSVHE